MTEPEQSIIAVLERGERAQLRQPAEAMPKISFGGSLLVGRTLGLRTFFIQR